MFDGIIFDLDGTLWDTSIEIEQIWKEVAENYNIKINPVVEEKFTAEKGENNKVQNNDETIAKEILPKAGIMSYILVLLVLTNASLLKRVLIIF